MTRSSLPTNSPKNPVQSCKTVCPVFIFAWHSCALRTALQIMITLSESSNVAYMAVSPLISTIHVLPVSSLYQVYLVLRRPLANQEIYVIIIIIIHNPQFLQLVCWTSVQYTQSYYQYRFTQSFLCYQLHASYSSPVAWMSLSRRVLCCDYQIFSAARLP